LQGTDHQFIGLMQQHEEEKNNDNEPAVVRFFPRHVHLMQKNMQGSVLQKKASVKQNKRPPRRETSSAKNH
jgi:hypothetical protein